MSKFICKNCKQEFDKFCDKLEDSLDVKCPSCGSHWVESIFEDDKWVPWEFPTLPYSDPPYPKPWVGDPFPPPPYRFWCRTKPNSKPITGPSEW